MKERGGDNRDCYYITKLECLSLVIVQNSLIFTSTTRCLPKVGSTARCFTLVGTWPYLHTLH